VTFSSGLAWLQARSGNVPASHPGRRAIAMVEGKRNGRYSASERAETKIEKAGIRFIAVLPLGQSPY
jgi:hypothetical protein